MQPYQCRVAGVIRGRGPFRPYPVRRRRLDSDVRRNLVLERTGVHVFAPLPVVVGTHPTGQLLAQRADLRIVHGFLPSIVASTLAWPAERRDRGQGQGAHAWASRRRSSEVPREGEG